MCTTNGCNPLSCADYPDANCGLQGDGCGGVVDCGSCESPQICGGGGVPSVCGGGCIPLTCDDYPAGTCGDVGDGCGGKITCATCTAPQTCGGDPKTPGICGYVCPALETCAQQKVFCGETGDGCGGILQCGTCPAGQTCGGGGVPSQCGAPKPCQPKTCAQIGATCGQQGDGCGGLTPNCGTCTGATTCRGTPSVCVAGPPCTKKTCANYPGACGIQADGCGGETANCGSCTAPQTCGGNGGGGAAIQTCGACGIIGFPPCGIWNPPAGCLPGLTNIGGVCGCAPGTVAHGTNACLTCGGDQQPPCSNASVNGGCNAGTVLWTNGANSYCYYCGSDTSASGGQHELQCANHFCNPGTVALNDGRCYTCGGITEPSCNGNATGCGPGTILRTGTTTCIACGAQHDVCCTSGRCEKNYTCVGAGNGSCECGSEGMTACSPGGCNAGLKASASGVCVAEDAGAGVCSNPTTCGTADGPYCCPGNLCGGGRCLACIADGASCSSSNQLCCGYNSFCGASNVCKIGPH